MPNPVAARSKVGVCGRLLTGIGLWDPAGHGCLSLVCEVRCQVEDAAKGRSLVQRIPTECDLETSIMRRFRTTKAVES
jgi:hypothetical protein